MQKLLIKIFFITALTPTLAQEVLLLEETDKIFTDMAQLEVLYAAYNQSMLIVEDQIYLIPCPCAPCRDMGAGMEGRNSSGDQAGRNAGGDSDGRGLGGDMDGRNQSGDEAGRGLGGDAEGRSIAGGSEGRNSGGERADRSLGGDSDGRNIGGHTDDRSLGGDADGRNISGDGEGRNSGADAAGRLRAGDTSSFACEKKSKSRFKLLNVNRNAQIHYFDGTEMTKISPKNGLVKY